MHIKRLAVPTASLLMIGALAACPPDKPQEVEPTTPTTPTEPEAPGGAVAEVNGTAIDRASFERHLDRTRSRFKQANREIPPALETRLKENILRRLVEDELIAQKAKAEGVELGEEEFEGRFAEHRKRFGTDKAYQDFLQRTGQSEDEMRRELRKSLMRERLYAKLVPQEDPSDEEAKAYYDKNIARYIEPEQVKASHILLKYTTSDPDTLKKEKMGKCKKLFREAKKKGADFAALAKENSEGPTAPRGGDLGFFPRGRMVKPFEEAVFAAKPGNVLGPIETQFGCHVIKLIEKKEKRERPFDEAKPSVLSTLKAIKKSESTRNLLNDLRQTAQVKVLEPGLKYQLPPQPVNAVPTTPGAPGTGAPPTSVKVVPHPTQAPAPAPMPKPAPAPAPKPAPAPAPAPANP